MGVAVIDNAVTEYRKRRSMRIDRRRLDDEWKTIKGTHVLVDDGGGIKYGPDRLKGYGKENRERVAKAAEGRMAKADISDKAKPKNTGYDYDPNDSFQEFVHKNVEATRPIYKEGKMDAVEDEWFKTRLQECTGDFKRLTDDEIDEIFESSVNRNAVRLWVQEYDHEIKPKIVRDLTADKAVHNAALNVMYDNYCSYMRNAEKKEPLSFEKFLVTPIKMYRGGSGKEYKKAGAFSSYTFDKGVAEGFKDNVFGFGSRDADGVVYEAEIRPIDTYGSVNTSGEMEIMVPSFMAPNGRRDGIEEQHFDWEWSNPAEWVYEDYDAGILSKPEPEFKISDDILDSIIRDAEMIELFATSKSERDKEAAPSVIERCIDSIQRSVGQMTAFHANGDSAFFQGELDSDLGEFEKPYPTVNMDSVYDEWLEEHLDDFEDEDEEIEFRNFKLEGGFCPENATDVDEVDMAFDKFKQAKRVSKYKKRRQDRLDARFVESEHPRDENGRFSGSGGNDSEFMDAARESESAVEFWMNLTEDQQKRVGKSYKEIYERVKPNVGKTSAWQAPKGKAEDMPVKLNRPEQPIKIEIADKKGKGTATADADIKGTIRLYANQEDTWSDHVLMHEIGHQISDMGLGEDVMYNHGNLWGRYNKEHRVVETPWGGVEKSPEESFAESFANYMVRPDWIKERAPEQYDYFKRLEKENPWISSVISDTKKAYDKAVSDHKKRMDAKDEPDAWITVNGNHIPIDGEGNPIGGQQKAIGGAHSEKKEPLTKKRANQKIESIADSDKPREEKIEAIKRELASMRNGTKIVMPDSWAYEDGKAPTYTYDKERDYWKDDSDWGGVDSEEMAGYFTDEDPTERPKIHSIPRDEESLERSRKKREESKHYAMNPNGKIDGKYTLDYRNEHVSQEERDRFKKELKELVDNEKGCDDSRALYRGEANRVGDRVADEVKRRAALRRGDKENAPINNQPQVEDIYDVLRDMREFGMPEGFEPLVNSDLPKERTDAIIKEAFDRFPTDWLRDTGTRPNIQIVDGPGRAACYNGGLIYVYTQKDLGLHSGELTTLNDRALVNDLAHELGHYVEHNNEKVSSSARDALWERGKDSEIIEVEPGYRGYKDSFFSSYMGKIYEYGETEIISMLMGNIGSFDPFSVIEGHEYNFGKGKYDGRKKKDKESLGYILGVLAGL